jgi:hypothetical protein
MMRRQRRLDEVKVIGPEGNTVNTSMAAGDLSRVQRTGMRLRQLVRKYLSTSSTPTDDSSPSGAPCIECLLPPPMQGERVMLAALMLFARCLLAPVRLVGGERHYGHCCAPHIRGIHIDRRRQASRSQSTT